MSQTDFEKLPFYSRPDLTPYLIHLTRASIKEGKKISSFEVLISILQSGELYGSGKEGYIKGSQKATCFMDIPFSALKYTLTADNRTRYEPYGIFYKKDIAYSDGCRPVIYLSDAETAKLNIPDDELWRIVRFEPGGNGWISWLHEREWRCPGNLKLKNGLGVFVKTPGEVLKLREMIANKQLNIIPSAIMPLDVLCQGLEY